jgi:hypothetical protein
LVTISTLSESAFSDREHFHLPVLQSQADLNYWFRSGGPFVKGLRRVIRDAQIGSLLIQSDNSTGEPLLFHTSVPDCIKSDEAVDTVVFLMDAQISTGAAAIMAIRVMLDHGIQGKLSKQAYGRGILLNAVVQKNTLYF